MRAASLTQQLLAFSRKQVLLPQEVDLNQTVLGLQSMLTRVIREDITLTCEVADEPALVKIDPTQIEQAILNLVLNARDALPAGGWIRLDVVRLSAPDVRRPPDAAAADTYVRLRVSDNGVGISPARGRICSSRSSPRRNKGRAPASGWRRYTGSCIRATDGSTSAANPGRARSSRCTFRRSR